MGEIRSTEYKSPILISLSETIMIDFLRARCSSKWKYPSIYLLINKTNYPLYMRLFISAIPNKLDIASIGVKVQAPMK